VKADLCALQPKPSGVFPDSQIFDFDFPHHHQDSLKVLLFRLRVAPEFLSTAVFSFQYFSSDDDLQYYSSVGTFTRVPISRSATFPLLKALGVASLGAGKRI
jgi:hypothetical protein